MMIAESDLAHVLWFTHQPVALRAALLPHLRPVTLARGQMAYLEGDESTGLWIILDGLLRLEFPVGDDRVALVGLMPGGAVFGRSRSGGAGSRIVSARAAQRTHALLLSDIAMERIAASHPHMWRALSEAVHGQLDASLNLLAQQLTLDPRARIAARLRQVAANGRAQVTQSDLADLTGLSRKAVNGHLATLEAGGLIARAYRRIDVIDAAGLAALAAH